MKKIKMGVVGIAWAALAGCAALQPLKPEPISTFSIEGRVVHRIAPPSLGAPTLQVSPVRAWPGFDTPRMAYARTPHELEYFARNQWVDTPARMLTPLLIQAAESSAAFGAVVTAHSGVAPQLRLESEIVRLQQEFMAVPSRIHFTLRVQLIDVAARKVKATRAFDVTENAASEDPYGGVVAANRAVNRVLAEMAAFCAAEAKAP